MSLSITGRMMLGLALGMLIGASLFTFCYAGGYSYLLNDPKVCANCHIMRENYNSWSVSSHRSVACNECHLPHSLLSKYVAKATNGYRHSWAFTFNPPDTIQIREHNGKTLQDNCTGCHEGLINHLPLSGDEQTKCVDCHRRAGHGM